MVDEKKNIGQRGFFDPARAVEARGRGSKVADACGTGTGTRQAGAMPFWSLRQRTPRYGTAGRDACGTARQAGSLRYDTAGWKPAVRQGRHGCPRYDYENGDGTAGKDAYPGFLFYSLWPCRWRSATLFRRLGFIIFFRLCCRFMVVRFRRGDIV